MESGVDEILIANRWLEPLQGALAFREGRQYLYFKLPKTELTAGGAAINSVDYEMEIDDSEQESCVSSEDEEEEKPLQEKEEPVQEEIHVAQVHISATRVSTQPRSSLASNERVVIDPQHKKIIVVKKKEADKLLLKFPNHKRKRDEQSIGWNWTKETQPVMVNSKTPGLLIKSRAPFKEGIKGSTRRHGKMTLAIISQQRRNLDSQRR